MIYVLRVFQIRLTIAWSSLTNKQQKCCSKRNCYHSQVNRNKEVKRGTLTQCGFKQWSVILNDPGCIRNHWYQSELLPRIGLGPLISFIEHCALSARVLAKSWFKSKAPLAMRYHFLGKALNNCSSSYAHKPCKELIRKVKERPDRPIF